MLTFIGCGSAFHTKLGNNGVFLKKENELFMIDCGSATFHRLMEQQVLQNVKRISILMTHIHPDHVGSLGDLIFYSYFKLEPSFHAKLTVGAPADLLEDLKAVIRKVGVEPHQVEWVEIKEGKEYGPYTITPISVKHAENLRCYGYELQTEKQLLYYSGDANLIPDHVFSKLIEGCYDFFYQDTSKADYPGNVHLSLRELVERVPEYARSVVCCMHLDQEFDINEAKEKGFQVATDYLI